MENGLMAYFDQFRYILGVLATLFILCHGILKPKDQYGKRVMLSCAGATVLALLRIPLWNWLDGAGLHKPLLLLPYWFIMCFLPAAIVMYCYETNWAGALFRTMISSYTENCMTILSYHILVLVLFRELPKQHPMLYMLIVLTIYTLMFAITIPMLRNRLIVDESDYYDSPNTMANYYFLAHLLYFVIVSMGKYFIEFEMHPMEQFPELETLYRRQVLFISMFLILSGVSMTAIMVAAYRMLTLLAEQQVLKQILRDREAQYAMSRESIENINRKSHDLKHQIRALEQISDDERREQLRQVSKSPVMTA